MAAVDMFLKLKGQKFDETSSIEVESWSFGASNPTSVGSGGLSAGKVVINDFQIMKKIDKWSPALFAACCGGEHQERASLSFYKKGTSGTGPADAYIKFWDCLISSVQQGGSQHGAPFPTESVSFTFQKIEWTYASQGVDVGTDANGGITVDLFLTK